MKVTRRSAINMEEIEVLHVNRVHSWWRSPPMACAPTKTGVLVVVILTLLVVAPELYQLLKSY